MRHYSACYYVVVLVMLVVVTEADGLLSLSSTSVSSTSATNILQERGCTSKHNNNNNLRSDAFRSTCTPNTLRAQMSQHHPNKSTVNPYSVVTIMRGGTNNVKLEMVSSNTEPSKDSSVSRNKRQLSKTAGMKLALFFTYFAVMGAKCALPSTLSLLTAQESGLVYPQQLLTNQQQMARVLTLSTVCTCVRLYSMHL